MEMAQKGITDVSFNTNTNTCVGTFQCSKELPSLNNAVPPLPNDIQSCCKDSLGYTGQVCLNNQQCYQGNCYCAGSNTSGMGLNTCIPRNTLCGGGAVTFNTDGTITCTCPSGMSSVNNICTVQKVPQSALSLPTDYHTFYILNFANYNLVVLPYYGVKFANVNCTQGSMTLYLTNLPNNTNGLSDGTYGFCINSPIIGHIEVDYDCINSNTGIKFKSTAHISVSNPFLGSDEITWTPPTDNYFYVGAHSLFFIIIGLPLSA